jgi:hypothetical protein
MTDPITPAPELVRHWSRFQGDTDSEALWFRIANEAAQWGADRELEACYEWLESNDYNVVPRELRAARRPKPPSLKEQAIDAVERVDGYPEDIRRIIRALEALPDD